MKRFLFLAAVLFSLSCAPVDARFPTGGSPASPTPPPAGCPKLVDGNCIAGILAGGLYYGAGTPGAAAGIAFMQQSGQSYISDVDYNRCAIEYGCGPNKADAAMVQGTAITNGQFTGCGAYSAATQTWACNFNAGTATVTIDGVHLKDDALSITNDGRTHVILSNMTFETGPFYCLNNSGSLVSFLGTTDVELRNYKVIEGPECSGVAELWGTPAAAGAGLTQGSTFTGTFLTGNGANGGILKVSPGTTVGTIYRKSFSDWPGRVFHTCCSGALSQFNQVLWITQWTGLVHTSGSSTTITIDSTDTNSPNANPAANNWMSWNSTATAAHQGNFVTSCNTGAHTCQLSSAVNFATPTAVAIGGRSCTGSGCDNAVLQMEIDPSAAVPNPVTVTTGPIHNVNPVPFNISTGQCIGFTSRFGFIVRMAYQLVSKSNCAVDTQSDYIMMEAGAIGYADLALNSSGVLHIDNIIQQSTVGSGSTIATFNTKYSTIWTTKWNHQGDLSCILCNYVNGPGTNYQTTETATVWDEDMIVNNTPINNFYDSASGVTTGASAFIHPNQQTFGTINATLTSASTSDNGDGTGTLHVVSNTGTVQVGDYILCATSTGIPSSGVACAVAPTGAMKITAQIGTAGGDVSTWTTSYYHSLNNIKTTGSFPGKITTNTWSNLFIDPTGNGVAGPLATDPNVPIGSYSCTNAISLVNGATYC